MAIPGQVTAVTVVAILVMAVTTLVMAVVTLVTAVATLVMVVVTPAMEEVTRGMGIMAAMGVMVEATGHMEMLNLTLARDIRFEFLMSSFPALDLTQCLATWDLAI